MEPLKRYGMLINPLILIISRVDSFLRILPIERSNMLEEIEQELEVIYAFI